MDWGMELEAMDDERHEADREMAELEREGRRVAALERRGICQHGARIGRSAWNHELYPEVAALAIGEELCRKCGKVFAADDPANWANVIRAAQRGRGW